MLLRDLQPGDLEVTVSALLGRSVGPATSLTARTVVRGLGASFGLEWAGWPGYRGPLTSHVPWADTSVEQTLRPVILGPTSSSSPGTWCLRPVATGWSGGVSGPCRRPGWAGGVEAWPLGWPNPILLQSLGYHRWCCPLRDPLPVGWAAAGCSTASHSTRC